MIGTGLFRLLLTLPAHVTQQKVKKVFTMNVGPDNNIVDIVGDG